MQLNELKSPYLIFLGSETDETYAKTGAGVAYWSPEKCMGQFHLEGGSVDLGLPEHSIESAAKDGAKTLLIGTAVVGGAIPKSWFEVLVRAMEHGMDIVAGVHTRLNDIPDLGAAADKNGVRLVMTFQSSEQPRIRMASDWWMSGCLPRIFRLAPTVRWARNTRRSPLRKPSKKLAGKPPLEPQAKPAS